MATLSELRNQHNLTQRGLANELGVSVAAISSWERGVTPIQPKYADDLCRILAIKPDEYHTLRQDTLDHAKTHKARRGAPKSKTTAEAKQVNKTAQASSDSKAEQTSKAQATAKGNSANKAAQAGKASKATQPGKKDKLTDLAKATKGASATKATAKADAKADTKTDAKAKDGEKTKKAETSKRDATTEAAATKEGAATTNLALTAKAEPTSREKNKVSGKDQPIIKSQAEFDHEKKARAQHFSNHQANLFRSLDHDEKAKDAQEKAPTKRAEQDQPSLKEKGPGHDLSEGKAETKKAEHTKDKMGTQLFPLGNFERLKRGKHRHGAKNADKDQAKAANVREQQDQGSKGHEKPEATPKKNASGKFIFQLLGKGMKHGTPGVEKEVQAMKDPAPAAHAKQQAAHPGQFGQPGQLGQPEPKSQPGQEGQPGQFAHPGQDSRPSQADPVGAKESPLEGQDYKSLENLFQEAFEGYQLKKHLPNKAKASRADMGHTSPLSYDAAIPPAARDLEHTMDRHLTQYQEQKDSQENAWKVAERTPIQGQGLRFVSATEMTSIAAHIALLTATKQGRMLLDHLGH